MKATTIGIDLAKNVFQIHGVDGHGKVVMKKQVKREQMAVFFANLPAALIGMEGLQQCPLLGAQAAGDGTYRQADGATVRQTLCKNEQERRSGRRGDLRGSRPAEHALCADQEHRAAGSTVTPSGTPGLRQRTHGTGQSDPRPAQ